MILTMISSMMKIRYRGQPVTIPERRESRLEAYLVKTGVWPAFYLEEGGEGGRQGQQMNSKRGEHVWTDSITRF